MEWPPEDAQALLAQWERWGRPEIELRPGMYVRDLRRWFYPLYRTTGTAEELERVRDYLAGLELLAWGRALLEGR